MATANTRALIVGAGPYGIAVAQELWRRGVDGVVVGEPFSLWFEHTLDSMRLRSDCRSSEIYTRDGRYSFERFLKREGESRGATPVATFRRYLRRVIEALPFDVVRQRVTRLEQRGDAFHARFSGGETISARAVVIATGLGPHRYLPEELRVLPAGRVLHSWDARRIERQRGARVLVVGAGQSAAEAVESLKRHNRLTWLLRHRPVFFSEPLRVPRLLFNAFLVASRGFFRLPPAVVRTLSAPIFKPTITPRLRQVFNDTGVHKIFEDVRGQSLRATSHGIASGASGQAFDRVVAATGYRFSVAGLPFLSEELAGRLAVEGRAPRLGPDFQTSVPGLYLTGGIAEPTFGPAMRFIFGSRHAARRLGAELAGA